MELYILTRLYMLIVPEFLRAKHRREALRDQRLACGLSLLVLDIITVMWVLKLHYLHRPVSRFRRQFELITDLIDLLIYIVRL